jgi:hypothetical protein
VDVRAPLLLANGCPFGICAGAHVAAAAPVGVLPGEQLMIPTPPGGTSRSDKKRGGGGGGGGVGGGGAAEMARRRVWIAACADDASPCGRPVPVVGLCTLNQVDP